MIYRVIGAAGVGQVVLQVASSTECKSCAGIEKADYPAKCSIIMEQEFRKLMLYFGKPYNPFTVLFDFDICARVCGEDAVRQGFIRVSIGHYRMEYRINHRQISALFLINVCQTRRDNNIGIKRPSENDTAVSLYTAKSPVDIVIMYTG